MGLEGLMHAVDRYNGQGSSLAMAPTPPGEPGKHEACYTTNSVKTWRGQ